MAIGNSTFMLFFPLSYLFWDICLYMKQMKNKQYAMITFRICDLFLEALVAGNIIPISFFFFQSNSLL